MMGGHNHLAQARPDRGCYTLFSCRCLCSSYDLGILGILGIKFLSADEDGFGAGFWRLRFCFSRRCRHRRSGSKRLIQPIAYVFHIGRNLFAIHFAQHTNKVVDLSINVSGCLWLIGSRRHCSSTKSLLSCEIFIIGLGGILLSKSPTACF